MATTTTDHEEIRNWAESKGGKPAAVDRTHHDGDVGLIRLMFPKSRQSEHDNLVEISWDEFFEQFDKADLALIYEDESLFNKLVGRDTAEKRQHGEHGSRHYPDSKHKTDRSPAQSTAHTKQDHATAESHSGTHEGGEKGRTDDLRSREYKDADGTVHHHTRAYQKEHASK